MMSLKIKPEKLSHSIIAVGSKNVKFSLSLKLKVNWFILSRIDRWTDVPKPIKDMFEIFVIVIFAMFSTCVPFKKQNVVLDRKYWDEF